MKSVEERKANFIRQALASLMPDDNLDFGKVEYVDNRTPVIVIDHSLKPDGTEYGEFRVTPSNFLKGRRHPAKRSQRISMSKQDTQESVVKRFREVHKGENLDYSQVEYKGMHVKVKIISHDLRPDGTEYGEFWQEPVVHLKGCTHPDIARDRRNNTPSPITNEEFIHRLEEIHKGKPYDYSLTEYTTRRGYVKVICHATNAKGVEHGVFEMMADNLYAGKGCPKCGNSLSVAEDEIYNALVAIVGEDNAVRRTRNVIDGYELDMYFPNQKLAVEFNGLRWHCEKFNKDKNYHLHKTELCIEKGIRLIHVFEDEYLEHKEIVLTKLLHIAGVSDKIRLGARQCTVRQIETTDARSFLNNNHIQGYANATAHYGAYYNNSLVGVMSFTINNKETNKWTLSRFATLIDCSITGLGSKMLKHFIEENNVSEVITFLDRRWAGDSADNLYTKMGFVLDHTIPPDYRYTNGHGCRLHKFGFRKRILNRKYGLPLTMTESEMTKELEYYKIWDCGLYCYVYTNPQNKTMNG